MLSFDADGDITLRDVLRDDEFISSRSNDYASARWGRASCAIIDIIIFKMLLSFLYC